MKKYFDFLIDNSVKKVEKYLNDNNIEYDKTNYGLFKNLIEIPLDDKNIDIDKLVNDIKDPYILKIAIKNIYASNNSIDIYYPGENVKLKKTYHVTHISNKEKIMKNGLIASEAQAHSNTFRNNNVIRPYKAVFVTSKISTARNYWKYTKFKKEDMLIFQIDSVNYTFYDDVLMRPELRCFVTFEDIKLKDLTLL